MATLKVGRFTYILHHPFSPFSICTAICNLLCTNSGCSYNQFNKNLSLTNQWTSSLFSILFYLENFNADVAKMIKNECSSWAGLYEFCRNYEFKSTRQFTQFFIGRIMFRPLATCIYTSICSSNCKFKGQTKGLYKHNI